MSEQEKHVCTRCGTENLCIHLCEKCDAEQIEAFHRFNTAYTESGSIAAAKRFIKMYEKEPREVALVAKAILEIQRHGIIREGDE